MTTEEHTKDTTYNGWTNRETWLVGVHDLFDHEHVIEMIEAIADRVKDTSPTWIYITNLLGDEMRDIHDDMIEEYIGDSYRPGVLAFRNSYVTDLLRTAANLINWDEIAGHYTETEEIKTAIGGKYAIQ